jgi:hypothetical protein
MGYDNFDAAVALINTLQAIHAFVTQSCEHLLCDSFECAHCHYWCTAAAVPTAASC